MSEELLFENNVTHVDNDVLKTLSELCSSHKVLEIEIEGIEKTLKEKKKRLEEISREKIPSVLNNYGLSEIKLSSGEKLELQDKIHSTIANKNYLLAYRNMILGELPDEADASDHDYEIAEQKINSIFKSQIILAELDNEEEVLDLLLDYDIPYENKKTIHPSTLKKYCKERLEQGKPIPEGISVFQYQETKIK